MLRSLGLPYDSCARHAIMINCPTWTRTLLYSFSRYRCNSDFRAHTSRLYLHIAGTQRTYGGVLVLCVHVGFCFAIKTSTDHTTWHAHEFLRTMGETHTYEERLSQPFQPTHLTFSEIQAAVPSHFQRKSFFWFMAYVARCASLSWIFFTLASHVDCIGLLNIVPGLRWVVWSIYWFWKSIAWAGFFTLGEHLCRSYLHNPHISPHR